MITRIIKLGIFLCVVLGVWYFGGQFFLEKGTDRALAKIRGSLSNLGIDVERVSVAGTDFSLPLIGNWRDFESRISANEDSVIARNAGFDVSIKSLSLKPASLSLDLWQLQLNDLKCESVFVQYPVEGPEIGELWLSIDSMQTNVSLSPSNAYQDLKAEYEKLIYLANRGSLADPVEVVGSFGFNMEGTPVSIRFESEQRGDRYGLRANLDDVRTLSGLYSVSLTEAEVIVVSKYPIQAPSMMRIQRYAKTTAAHAHRKDRTVPEDAYRHLLWSFLLTNKFGIELAQEIATAHELGVTDNTEADHRMDYHNNEIGRKYALEGRRESEILKLARNDSNVIRVAR